MFKQNKKEIIMAKINGIELKNIVKYRGHEGEPLVQGTIYIDGKKSGFYSQGDWGGPDTLDFISNEKKNVFNDKASSYSQNKVDKERFDDILLPEDLLLCDLLYLLEKEKKFKKVTKQGCDGVIYYVWNNEQYIQSVKLKKIVGNDGDNFIRLFKKVNPEFTNLSYYFSLDDFDIKSEAQC
jgi:hypothetical protein